MQNFYNQHQEAISKLNGVECEQHFYNITGHGLELRIDNTIDYCPTDEEESGDDEYVLSLSVFRDSSQDNTGPYCISLELQHAVCEVGVQDKHSFSDDLKTNKEDLDRLVLEWNMSARHAYQNGEPFLNKVNEFLEYLKASGVDYKWSA